MTVINDTGWTSTESVSKRENRILSVAGMLYTCCLTLNARGVLDRFSRSVRKKKQIVVFITQVVDVVGARVRQLGTG